MAAWFPFTGISHQSPPLHPLDFSLWDHQQSSPWDCSTIPKLQLPAAAPSRGPVFLSSLYGCNKDCLILIPFRLPHISCFTLSLKCFSSDSDSCPDVGMEHLLQYPHLLRAGPVLLLLLFLPQVHLSYWGLHGPIYSFSLVRYSCLLSADVLNALLCLKAYPWCIHEDRCTPYTLNLLPSSSSSVTVFLLDSTAMIIPLCLPDHLSTSLLHLFYSWFLYWIFQYNTIQLFYCLFLFVLYLLGLC